MSKIIANGFRHEFTWLLLIAGLILFISSCRPKDLPDTDSPEYAEVVRNFFSAAARIQTSQDVGAEERLLRAGELAPGEPAIWYNLAALYVKRNEIQKASQILGRARETGISNSRVLLLSGMVQQRLGYTDEALSFMRNAVEADSSDVRALWSLALELRYQNISEAQSDSKILMDQILEIVPRNTAAVIEAARHAAEDGDTARLSSLLERLRSETADWPPETAGEIRTLEVAAQSGDLSELVGSALRLQNRARRIATYQRDLGRLVADPLDPSLVMTRFVVLPTPSGEPSPPDTSLTFTRSALTPDSAAFDWLGSVFATAEGPLVSVSANGTKIRMEPDVVLPFPGGASSHGIPVSPVAFLDYDYDFRMDVAAAGAGGLRIFRQEPSGDFTDRTSQLGLPKMTTDGRYSGVWSMDFDLEGDTDLLLSTAEGPLRLLRNNGDDTFTVVPVLAGVEEVRQVVWADIDNDGDPDAGLLDRADVLHLCTNHRSGSFSCEHVEGLPAIGAINAGDIDGDGTFDLLLLDKALTVRATSWESGERLDRILVTIPERLFPPVQWTRARIALDDLDNNGGLDLVVAVDMQAAVFLQGTDREFKLLHTFDDLYVFGGADLYASGNLSLIAVDESGSALHLVNRTQREYLSRSFLVRAADSLGDRRNNSFGIGGEIEIRTGLLYQKRPISGPLVHFGIGDQPIVDVARIIWPNGTSQALFDLESDQTLLTRESLKGSCPWVFAYDGDSMGFVTDFIWRSPLGLRINDVVTAGIATTEDWIKIDGSELAPRNSVYDVRITAELWETHFFDLIELRAIDHPVGTEVFVNEAFVFPPDPLAVHLTGGLESIRYARDHEGRDITDLVSKTDNRHVGGFDLYKHQGRAAEHSILLDLGAVPADKPVWLIGSGWIRPTDSSINVALGQGDHPLPSGVRLEVENDDGTWTVLEQDLGFPSGKSKTMLMDLSGAFSGRTKRIVRLTTNLEIYWDSFFWAEALDIEDAAVRTLETTVADLRYRGFSRVTEDSRSAPELPDYNSLASSGPLWRDLIGFYTRFGDVTELLSATDDRYMIMNAGDELAMQFRAPPPPGDGWTRDFVLVGDGWVKDGDYNTTYSKTVTPLPRHSESDYTAPLIDLEDNPAYRAHPEDWSVYHTRYVSTDDYVNALRTAVER